MEKIGQRRTWTEFGIQLTSFKIRDTTKEREEVIAVEEVEGIVEWTVKSGAFTYKRILLFEGFFCILTRV